MIYEFDEENKILEPQPFFDYADLNGKEKDLENLLAEYLGDLYVADGQLMPIFQERQWQAEPDLCALDSSGNLIIFELKRSQAPEDASLQVMKYVQSYGRKSYSKLNSIFQNYTQMPIELRDAHKEAFQLDTPLSEVQFNKHQKMVIVGSSSDSGLIDSVEYWKQQGLDIDFLPYRFYKLGSKLYFEFFAKPYDYHMNPKDVKGIIFDTNRSYDEDAIWDMFAKKKVSAYGGAARFAERFNKGDYVFYYHVSYGIVGAGIVETKTVYSDTTKSNTVEKYRTVKLLTPAITNESEIRYLTPSQIKKLLGHGFYWASTVKTPYLNKAESEILVKAIQAEYQ